MIKIEDKKSRILQDLANSHYELIKPLIIKNVVKLRNRQRVFVEANLKEILCSKPSDLIVLHKKYLKFCTKSGKGVLKKPLVGLRKVFNYKSFSSKNSDYNAYSLAFNLDIRACPFCNRNFTNTVVIKSKKNKIISQIIRPDFDHYLSQVKYPLFSLSIFNLIPCCLVCNRTLKQSKPLSPNSHIHPYSEGFGSYAKFNYTPGDTDSALGLGSNLDIYFEFNAPEDPITRRIKRNINVFKLQEIYNSCHKNEIREMIYKHCVTSGNYLYKLKMAFPELGTIEEIYQFGFGSTYGEEMMDGVPLSKFKRDIFDRLEFKWK